MADEKGSELFTVDAEGRRQDASLHQDILDNAEAEEFCRMQTIRRMLDAGMSRETIRALYGDF